MKIFRNAMLGLALTSATIASASGEAGDTAYTFRFLAARDMFYVPFRGNERELQRLEACVDSLRERILAGQIPVRVFGYSSSQPTERANRAMAKTRSNRVKSELIVRKGLTEQCFITRNHTSGGNYVMVTINPNYGADAIREDSVPAEVIAKDTIARDTVAVDSALYYNVEAAPVDSAAVAVAPAESGRESKVAAWYVGVEGGVPFAVSSFTAFADDKTRAGWTAGVYVGRRFSSTLAVELQAAYAQANLASRSCCPDYWIGADNALYEGAVAGSTGWSWHSLKSRVSMMRFGAQLNVNVLGLFNKTRRSRWAVELAPSLAAIATQADYLTIANSTTVSEGSTRWHLGLGGRLQVAYRLTNSLSLGLYSGLTHLTGSHLDGTPEHLHKSNFIWESGLRLGFDFSNQRKETDR